MKKIPNKKNIFKKINKKYIMIAKGELNMKFIFEQCLDKEEIIAYGKEKNELIKTIENMCLQDENSLFGYLNGTIKELNPNKIECFITCGEKVYALMDNKKYLVKKRLYELNEKYNSFYIYINQGCLANINHFDYFDTSIGGALIVVFKSGYKDYISRRQIKNVKERIGLKKWKA